MGDEGFVFEVVDVSAHDRYYTLGIFESLHLAEVTLKSWFHKDHSYSEFSDEDDLECYEIHKRKFNAYSDGGVLVYSVNRTCECDDDCNEIWSLANERYVGK